MIEDWEKPEVADAWSDKVGIDGDLFQRCFIKPYVTACLIARFSEKPISTSTAFYQIIAEALRKQPYNSTDQQLFINQLETCCKRELEGLKIEKLTVLDVGCGEAYLSRWLSGFVRRYIGVDPSEVLIESAKNKCGNDNRFTFVVGKIEKLVNISKLSELTGEHTDDVEDVHLVICTNVIDHVENFAPALRHISKIFGGQVEKPIFMFSTLNPSFFMGVKNADGLLQKGHIQDRKQEVALGSTNCKVDIIARNWQEIERGFLTAKLDISSLLYIELSQFPFALQNDLINYASLIENPGGGPFTLWSATPMPWKHGVEQNLSQHEDRLSALAIILRTFKQKSETPPNTLVFREQELVASAGTLPAYFYLVEEGTVILEDNGHPFQTFQVGQVIGELETGLHPIASRLLYALRAGSKGCILRGYDSTEVLKYLEMEQTKTLGAALYTSIRDRFANHSLVLQRKTTMRRGDKIAFQGSKKSVSAERIKESAIALMHGLGAEINFSTSVNKEFNLSLIDDVGILKSIANGHYKHDGTQRANDSSSSIFHGIGAIDTFNLNELHRDSRFQTIFEDHARSIAWRAIQSILIDGLKGKFHGEEATKLRIHEIEQQVIDQMSSNNSEIILNDYPINLRNFLKWQIAGNQKSELTLSAQSGVPLVKDLHSKLCENVDLSLNQRDVIVAQVYKTVLNIAWLKNEILRKGQRFYVIKDPHFLRRIATDQGDWMDELKARINVSPYYNTSESSRPQINTVSLNEEIGRIKSYLEELELYVSRQWAQGQNLEYTSKKIILSHGMIDMALEKLCP